MMTENAPPSAMTPAGIETIHRFVVSYFDAFARDPAAASLFYAEPAIFVSHKAVQTLHSHAAIESVLASMLRGLKQLGYSHSRVSEPRVKMLNAATALYGGIAVRMTADEKILEQLPVTYLVRNGPEGWRIHVLIATDADKLIGTADGGVDPA